MKTGDKPSKLYGCAIQLAMIFLVFIAATSVDLVILFTGHEPPRYLSGSLFWIFLIIAAVIYRKKFLPKNQKKIQKAKHPYSNITEK